MTTKLYEMNSSETPLQAVLGRFKTCKDGEVYLRMEEILAGFMQQCGPVARNPHTQLASCVAWLMRLLKDMTEKLTAERQQIQDAVVVVTLLSNLFPLVPPPTFSHQTSTVVESLVKSHAAFQSSDEYATQSLVAIASLVNAECRSGIDLLLEASRTQKAGHESGSVAAAREGLRKVFEKVTDAAVRAAGWCLGWLQQNQDDRDIESALHVARMLPPYLRSEELVSQLRLAVMEAGKSGTNRNRVLVIETLNSFLVHSWSGRWTSEEVIKLLKTAAALKPDIDFKREGIMQSWLVTLSNGTKLVSNTAAHEVDLINELVGIAKTHIIPVLLSKDSATVSLAASTLVSISPIAMIPAVLRRAGKELLQTLRRSLSAVYARVWPHILNILEVCIISTSESDKEILDECIRVVRDLATRDTSHVAKEATKVLVTWTSHFGFEHALTVFPLSTYEDNEATCDDKSLFLLPIIQRSHPVRPLMKTFLEKVYPLTTAMEDIKKRSLVGDPQPIKSVDQALSQCWGSLSKFLSDPADLQDSLESMTSVLVQTYRNYPMYRACLLRGIQVLVRTTRFELDKVRWMTFARDVFPDLLDDAITAQGSAIATTSLKLLAERLSEETRRRHFKEVMHFAERLLPSNGDKRPKNHRNILWRIAGILASNQEDISFALDLLLRCCSAKPCPEVFLPIRLLALSQIGAIVVYESEAYGPVVLRLVLTGVAECLGTGKQLTSRLALAHAFLHRSPGPCMQAIVPFVDLLVACMEAGERTRVTETVHRLCEVAISRTAAQDSHEVAENVVGFDHVVRCVHGLLISEGKKGGTKAGAILRVLVIILDVHSSRLDLQQAQDLLCASLAACGAPAQTLAVVLLLLKAFPREVMEARSNEIVRLAFSVPKKHRCMTRCFVGCLLDSYPEEQLAHWIPEESFALIRSVRKERNRRKSKRKARQRKRGASEHDTEEEDGNSVDRLSEALSNAMKSVMTTQTGRSFSAFTATGSRTKRPADSVPLELCADIDPFSAETRSVGRAGKFARAKDAGSRQNAPKDGVSVAIDGRLFIKGISDVLDRHVKKRKTSNYQGLESSSDSDASMSEDSEDWHSKMPKKRARPSDSTKSMCRTSSDHKSDRGKPRTKHVKRALGRKFRAKGGIGDVQRSGDHEPYAYVPLGESFRTRSVRAAVPTAAAATKKK